VKGSNNYQTRKFSTKMTLAAKDLWEVVETNTVPLDIKEAAEWQKKPAKAFVIIALSLSASEQ